MDVDFAPPVGYQEPDYKAQALAEKAAKAVKAIIFHAVVKNKTKLIII